MTEPTQPIEVPPTLSLTKAEPATGPLLGGVGPLPAVVGAPPTLATDPPHDPASVGPGPEAPRGPRTGTVLWGLAVVVAAIAILAVAAGEHVDFSLVAIGVLALAGATLVIGSIVSAARRRRHP